MARDDGRPSGVALPEGAERRKHTLVGGFLRTCVDPWLNWLYWRLDLNDPKTQRPAYNKVKTTIVLILLVCVVGDMSIHIGRELGRLEWAVTHGVATDVSTLASLLKVELSGFFSLCVFMGFFAYGLAGLKVWADSKTAQATVGTVTAAIESGAKEIAARRDAAGGDHEPAV